MISSMIYAFKVCNFYLISGVLKLNTKLLLVPSGTFSIICMQKRNFCKSFSNLYIIGYNEFMFEFLEVMMSQTNDVINSSSRDSPFLVTNDVEHDNKQTFLSSFLTILLERNLVSLLTCVFP